MVNIKRANEIEASKAKSIEIAKGILEQNRGNEKAVASGQIALMEKTINWLETNCDYSESSIWGTNYHAEPTTNDVRHLLADAVKEMAK